jgi:MerR family mercuric resistance operon transcriptional regulator
LPDPRPQKTGAAGIRHYGPDEERRLRFIRSAQAAGFTLEEIAELERARHSLAKLARDCAAGGKGPCPIIAAFEHA